MPFADKVTTVQRIDKKLYYIKCKHSQRISEDDSLFCHWCQDWILGIQVGDFTIELGDDGGVVVSGGGYVAEMDS